MGTLMRNHTRRKFLQSLAMGTGMIMINESGADPLALPAVPSKEDVKSIEKILAPSTSSQFFAQATNFEESVAYRPGKRPGYCSWVTVWKDPKGSLLMNFCERRRHPNPIYHPIPLDFWEAMGLPIKYQSQLLADPEILPETVILQSLDQGTTWNEVGRSLLVFEPLAFTSLPDGTILRGIENAYTSYYASEKVVCRVQKSNDLGNTWKDVARLEDDFWFSPYRMTILCDGTIAMLGIYTETFGPGRDTVQRTSDTAYQHMKYQAAFFYSSDQGLNWQGPVIVLPGINTSEPEWVELPSGDLLVINCSVQGGPNTRQVIRRQGKRFIPQAVFDIVSGSVPETFIMSKEGLLVGTRRGGVYSCSNDLGNTWHTIGGLPKAMYQPRIIQLDDGRFLSAAHLGGDNFVGEIDQYIGQHRFRLEEHLPSPTILTLVRDKNAAGTQFLNAYTARLQEGNKPLAKRELKFTVQASTRNRRSYKKDEFVQLTDSSGQAHLALPEFDESIDIHRDYTIQAEYLPPALDTATAPARSPKYMAYRLTSTAGRKNTYPCYVAGQRLFVEQEILEKFPEIHPLVKTFGLKPSFSGLEMKKELKLPAERQKALIEALQRHRVLLRTATNDVFQWNEVELREVQPITVTDDFLP